jgi:hypothetical protein
MNILLISAFSAFIVNVIVKWLHIYTIISLVLFIAISVYLSKNRQSWNILKNLKEDLSKYNISHFFVFIYILFYLWVWTFLIFVLPDHPDIYGFPMTEMLPFYTITNPIVSLLLIQLPISWFMYLCINIYIFFKKFTN